MFRSARLWALALLFAATAAVQVRLTWSTLRFVAEPENVHYRLPMSDRLVKAGTAFGGLEPGDHIVAVDGVPVVTRWQVQQVVVRRPVGAPIRLTVERGAGRRDVEVPSRPWPIGTWERVYTVMQNVVTPWFSLVLGFFIAFRRPHDRMAWLVLFVLLGMQQFYAYLFQSDEWGALIAGLLRFTSPLFRLGGVAAWLWLGYDFYAGRRLLPWLRWPLTLLVLYHAAYSAARDLAGLHFPQWLDGLEPWTLPQWLITTVVMSSMVLGFANLIYRMVGEVSPDTRRRLRLMVAGAVAGRGPVLFLEIAGLLGRPTTSFPVAVWAPAISAVVLLPVAFAYVLIVDRAMDVGVVVRQGLQYAFARRGLDVLRAVFALLPLVLVENRWAAIAGSLAALLLVGPVAERLRGWIDRRFFREAVQAERVLAGIAEPLRGVTEPAAVLRVVAERVAAALHVTSVATWVKGDGARPAWLDAAAGDTLALPVNGADGLLGALHLGEKKSQEPYSPAEKQLLESVAHQAALAMENATLTRAVADEAAQRERIQRELEIAKDVQARLLPKRDPQVPGLSVAGVCRPAQSIGGDSYDYIVSGGRLLVTVADVAGKGVPAALLMSNLQAALRGLTLGGHEENLAATLGRLNELVFDSTPANRFITLFALALEADGRLVRYASAGHNPAGLLRAGGGTVEWIRTNGVALGLRRGSVFAEAAVTLGAGDTLVLYTDGVTEAVNRDGEEFGESRLAEAMAGSGQLPAAALRDALVGAVDAFAAGAPQHDDITLVVLRAEG